MLKVGSQFDTFDELSQRLEEFQKVERVQLWVRDSRTVIAAAKRARRKSLNPALKYAELTYSCVFGGRRPSDQSKVHNQTSAGGCPFKVRLSTSGDGQALVVKEICHNHNHEPGKKLHDEPRRLYKKTHHSRAAQDAQESATQYSVHENCATTNHTKPIKLIVSKHRLNNAGQPFANLQQHLQQHNHNQQHLKVQLTTSSPQPQQQQHLPQQQHHHHHHQQHHQQQQQQQQQQHHQQCFIKQEPIDQLTELDLIGDCLGTPDHLLSSDPYHPYNTPSNSSSTTAPTTPSSSGVNTPNNSPNTSPTNSLSSGLEEPVLSFNLPPSPISPSSESALYSLERAKVQQEDQRLEPLYDLSEALESSLSSLPSVGDTELPHLPAASTAAATMSPKFGSNDPHHHHNTVTTQLPRVRPFAASHSVKVAYSSAGNTVYKSKPITTPPGNLYINTESGLIKKCSNGATIPNVQYNLMTNKVGSFPPTSNRNPGRITIQHMLTNQTSNVSNNVTSSKGNGVTTGSSFIVGINGTVTNSTNNVNTTSTIPGSVISGSGGAIRNYRAKIAKKPYGVGVLKVVRSDNITSPIDNNTYDRLINTVTPNKSPLLKVIKSEQTSPIKESELSLPESCSFTNKVFSNLFSEVANDSVVIKPEPLDSDILTHLKTEPLDTFLEPDLPQFAIPTSVVDGVIGGNTKDDLDLDSESLFVMDGLHTSAIGDIPMKPEFLFNVAEIEDYDFFMF